MSDTGEITGRGDIDCIFTDAGSCSCWESEEEEEEEVMVEVAAGVRTSMVEDSWPGDEEMMGADIT